MIIKYIMRNCSLDRAVSTMKVYMTFNLCHHHQFLSRIARPGRSFRPVYVGVPVACREAMLPPSDFSFAVRAFGKLSGPSTLPDGVQMAIRTCIPMPFLSNVGCHGLDHQLYLTLLCFLFDLLGQPVVGISPQNCIAELDCIGELFAVRES